MGSVNTVELTHILALKSCVEDAATDSAVKMAQICRQEDARPERKFESTSNLL